MAKTYSLNDLGVTADDLILLDASGYDFDETDNISEEKRDEILNRLYDLKQKAKENASKEVPATDYSAQVEAATPEQAKQMKYELKNGEQLDLQDVASIVKSEQIVSKELRAEMKRVIVEAANADHLAKEDVASLGYLLDEINGKHAEERGNAHSVHEYRKQFDDNPEVLEAAARKLETANVYNSEELEALLRQGEIYLKKPEEILENPDAGRRDNHQQLFENHVHEVETLIKGYAAGRVSIEPDAMESMEKLLDAYGKDYVRGTASSDKLKNGVSYDITQEACDAQQRLAHERVEAKKNKDAPVEEKVEVKAEEKGPSNEELEAAKKKKPKDRTLRDWIVLKEGIENNPKLSDGQKKYELKSLMDQARGHKMNKSPKDLSSDELKDADAFMAAFGYDIDRKGRAATNPVAMKWKEAVDKRRKAEEAERAVVVDEQPREQPIDENKKEDNKGKGGAAPVVVPGRHITNDKGVTEWQEQGEARPQEKEKKKKKGLFGRMGDWAKRNWKKVAIGGAILAASLFGAKQCQSQQQDDKGKDKIEVVTPTPEKELQLPEVVVTGEQKYDLDMAHQYCKRMGYQNDLSEDNAIAKFLNDRMTYATVKEKVAGHLGIDSLSIDQQMAVLATVRGNTPEYKAVINGILNGREPGGENGYNVATLAKLKKETAKFAVRTEDGTIQYRNPEEFTKQTGTQSIDINKDNIVKKAAVLNWKAESYTK